jgi:N-acetylglutamate synthase-like GNAT family acetyltransferase
MERDHAEMKTPLRFSDSREIDPKEVLALYHYADWSKDRTLEETQQVLSQSSLVFSLWEGPRLVAFGRVLTDFIFRAAVYDVIVHPDVQRQGVGRALIYKILTHPSLKKVPVFYLLTRDKRPFYEKLGFVTTEEEGYSSMIFVRKETKP